MTDHDLPTAETRDYAALDRAVEESNKFPFPQRDQLERIATKLRFLAITSPEDKLCDEAQGGLGYLLTDIAAEVASILEDCQEECEARLAALAASEAKP